MSVEDTLAERGERYGDFSDHARICQALKDTMVAESAGKWKQLPDIHKQALEVIADKIARILSGDPNYADNWHDIQGYAKLVEDRLPKLAPTPENWPAYESKIREDNLVLAKQHKVGFCSHGVENWMNCVHCQAGEVKTNAST